MNKPLGWSVMQRQLVDMAGYRKIRRWEYARLGREPNPYGIKLNEVRQAWEEMEKERGLGWRWAKDLQRGRVWYSRIYGVTW